MLKIYTYIFLYTREYYVLSEEFFLLKLMFGNAYLNVL